MKQLRSIQCLLKARKFPPSIRACMYLHSAPQNYSDFIPGRSFWVLLVLSNGKRKLGLSWSNFFCPRCVVSTEEFLCCLRLNARNTTTFHLGKENTFDPTSWTCRQHVVASMINIVLTSLIRCHFSKKTQQLLAHLCNLDVII